MSLFRPTVQEVEVEVEFETPSPMPRAETTKPVRVTKATMRQDIVSDIQSNGMQTPLEFLVRILNDENLPRNERVDAAKATLPYVHSRLNSIDINANVSVSHEDALAFLENDE